MASFVNGGRVQPICEADRLRACCRTGNIQFADVLRCASLLFMADYVEYRIRAERGNFHISRKEIRRETTLLKKSSTTHRSEIAALKRRVQELERQLRRASRTRETSAPIAANEDSVSPGTRFSAKSIASQRRRLGLSAAECGLLIGASAQSVYNWEEGKARPRSQHLPAIFALRNLGHREANEIPESRKAA